MRTQVQAPKLLGPLSLLTILGIGMAGGVGGGLRLSNRGSLIDPGIGADVFFEIIYPPELEYTYKLRPARDFGAPFNASFFEESIPLVPTDPPNGCRLAENADELRGHIALVERGDCSFFTKSITAEEAGAKAVIIADYHASSLEESINSPLWTDHYYIEMIRDSNVEASKTVNIPAGFLLGKNGRMIRQTLKRLSLPFALINIPVNLTFTSIDKLQQPPWLFW